MVRLLRDIGRTVIVLSVIATVLACAAGGYQIGRAQEIIMDGIFDHRWTLQLTISEAIFALIGGGLGIVIVSTVLNSMNALQDIRDSQRVLAREGTMDHPPAARNGGEQRDSGSGQRASSLRASG